MLGFRLQAPQDAPLTMLCLGSHCDDIEIGCGGAILKLLREHPGATVHWVVFSSTRARAQEARSSAERFLSAAGSRSIGIFEFTDGFFPYEGAEIKRRFEQLKGEVNPDLIFTHCRDDRHQDHRLLWELTWNTFRNHTVLEYEIPKYDGDLGQPNFFVHLDEATCREKFAILHECFASQRGKHWFTEDTFFALLRLRGVESASPTRYAEAFYCRKGVIR